MVGFALAEYSNGDHADPVRLTWADQCHSRFFQRQARAEAPLPSQASSRRKRAPPARTRLPARTRSRRSAPEIQ
jgi:hypothetical protein